MTWLSEARAWCAEFERIWEAEKSKKTFADVAYAHFSQRRWHDGFQLLPVLQEFMANPPGKQQNANSNFGNPPLTIYAAKDKEFFLDIYIWHEAHTSIHEHAFQGAFCVLQGSSVESHYRFTKTSSIGADSAVGKLESENVRLLKTGDSAMIKLGSHLIHRVIHLENPTVSLVLRTNRDKPNQMSYYFDCFESPSHPPEEKVVKLRVLEWFLRHQQPVDATVVNDILDQHQTWLMLFRHAETFQLAKKLSIQLCGMDLLLGEQRHFGFQKCLTLLQEPEHKLILCLMEQFNYQWSEEYTKLTQQNGKAMLSELQEILKHKVDPQFMNNFFIKAVIGTTP